MPKNTYMNRDGTYNRSRLLLTVLGVGIVAGTVAFSAVGTTTAINAMNRQSEEAIAAAQAAVMENQGAVATDTSSDETEIIDVEGSSSSDMENAQADWMKQYGVTYNDDGFPVDEFGHVIDNPFTSVYEPDLAAEFYGENEADSGEAESEPITGGESSWWLNDDGSLKDGLSLDEDGNPYYVIQSGDQLGKIASRYGFDYMELAEFNGIEDPNMIITGDILYFPDSAGNGALSTAPGLG